MTYSTLIWGAFDTVIRIDHEQWPICEVDGRAVRTTAPAVHREYCALFGDRDATEFNRAFVHSLALVNDYRKTESREVSSQERMRVLLRLLGHDAVAIPDEILERLTSVHVERIAPSFSVPSAVADAVRWAARSFGLALVVNFDHAPLVYRILEAAGLRSRFDVVVVSEEVGWRLPHRVPFERVLEQLGVASDEALFVGDQLYPDAYGAINAGLDTVWVKTGGQDARSAGLPSATYTIRSILDLIPLLQGRPHRARVVNLAPAFLSRR